MRHSIVVIGFIVVVIALAISIEASDPSPLQDICVATDDMKYSVRVNGEFCKDPARTTSEDFRYRGFNIAAETSNKLGVNATLLTPKEYPAVNTGGVTMSRIDFARRGVNPPHFHTRATEVFLLVKGRVKAGFITSNPEHRHFPITMKPGDLYTFPVGLVHYQYNIGRTNAIAYAAFSSQNPGVVTVANTMFDAKPSINRDLLAKSWQLNITTIKELQKKTWINP